MTDKNNINIQVKASIWYTICNFYQKGISFIVVPIYTRLLTTAEYGQWSVFQSWRDILIIFASLNLYCGVYTKTLVDIKKEDRDYYTASMQGLGTIFTLGFAIIYLCFSPSFLRLLELNTQEMWLLILYFVLYPAFSFWSTRQRVEYKYREMVFVTIVVSILTPVISLLLLFTTSLRSGALIYGYLLVQCGIGGIFYVLQFIKGRCFFDKGYWKYALKFNIPLIPHYLSLIVLAQSDRIMIKYFCSNSDAGIYSFAYQIASALGIFITAINGSRVPWTYEKLKAKNFSRLKPIANALSILMGILVVALSLVTPELIAILGTQKYLRAEMVIPIVALGVYFTFCYDLFCTVEFYFGATNYVMIASVTGAILNIILNWIFIPIYGFIAAAYTTLICYILFMLAHCFFMNKTLKKEHIYESVYDLKRIFIISIITCIFTILCMLIYSLWFVRYGIVIVVLILLFINRNKINHMLKEIK